MLEFEWPWVAMAVLLPLIMLLLPRVKHQLGSALKVPSTDHFTVALDQAHSSERLKLTWFIAYLAYAALVIAAMRPVWIGDAIQLPLEGRDLVMAIDLSGSMREDDMRVRGGNLTRIEATQLVASEFVEKRQGDRIGLIVFGEEAYIQTPLTFDLKTIRQHIEESRIGFAGERATVIGDAIGLAVKRLRESEVKDKTLILLTDGVDTGSKIPPLKAAELAREDDLKIYTIGIGAGQQRSFFGRRNEIDEATLTEIANMTGGKYFRARNTRELQDIYNLIDQLEPVESDTKTFKPKNSLFYIPLTLALFISGLLFIWNRVQRGGL